MDNIRKSKRQWSDWRGIRSRVDGMAARVAMQVKCNASVYCDEKKEGGRGMREDILYCSSVVFPFLSSIYLFSLLLYFMCFFLFCLHLFPPLRFFSYPWQALWVKTRLFDFDMFVYFMLFHATIGLHGKRSLPQARK